MCPVKHHEQMVSTSDWRVYLLSSVWGLSLTHEWLFCWGSLCESSSTESTAPWWLQNKTTRDDDRTLLCTRCLNVLLVWGHGSRSSVIPQQVYVSPRCLYVPGQDCKRLFLSSRRLFCSLAWRKPLHFPETVIQQERRGNNLWWVDLPTAYSCQHSGQWRMSRDNVSIQTGSVIFTPDY